MSGRPLVGKIAKRRELSAAGAAVLRESHVSAAEEVDADRDTAHGGRLPAQEDPVAAGLAGDHVEVADVLEAPADVLDVAKNGGGARRSPVTVGAAEPGRAGVSTDFELDLEEPLPRFFRSGGRANGSCQESVPPPLLLRRLRLLSASSLLASLLSLTLLTL